MSNWSDIKTRELAALLSPSISDVESKSRAELGPRIIAFLCNWCSYAGADLAGSLHKDYPPNIRIIRVMCTGRVDSTLILQAFAQGADGVLISGCHLGECHYRTGNYKVDRTISLLRSMLAQMHINPDRLLLTWVSASEAVKFSRVVTQFTEDLTRFGPLNPR